MKEILTMWKYPKMMVLTFVSTALYALCLIPFKGWPLIPGVAEIRPAAVLPPLLGILFGPAGAWGCALGNVVGDYFGHWTAGSVFGALGNFFFAMVAYKVWGQQAKNGAGKDFSLANPADLQRYIALCFLSCASVAFVVAWGVEFLRLHAFAGHGSVILMNNLAATLVFGPFLFKLFYSRSKAWNLLWWDVVAAPDRSLGLFTQWGIRLLWIGAVGGLIVGLAVSHVFYQNPFLDSEIIGNTDTGVVLITTPFLILFLLGCLLS